MCGSSSSSSSSSSSILRILNLLSWAFPKETSGNPFFQVNISPKFLFTYKSIIIKQLNIKKTRVISTIII